MNCSVIAILLNVKESVEEADNLPKNLHKSIIAVADMVASIICGFVGCIRCVGLFRFNGFLKLVSAAVVTEIIAVFVLVSASTV